MSKDIAAFIAARLDEDEASIDTREHDSGQCDYLRGVHLEPQRALREVEADRKLLREYQSAASARGGDWTEGEAGHADGLEAGLLLAVKIRAERFSDHPDYRGEWKP